MKSRGDSHRCSNLVEVLAETHTLKTAVQRFKHRKTKQFRGPSLEATHPWAEDEVMLVQG